MYANQNFDLGFGARSSGCRLRSGRSVAAEAGPARFASRACHPAHLARTASSSPSISIKSLNGARDGVPTVRLQSGEPFAGPHHHPEKQIGADVAPRHDGPQPPQVFGHVGGQFRQFYGGGPGTLVLPPHAEAEPDRLEQQPRGFVQRSANQRRLGDDTVALLLVLVLWWECGEQLVENGERVLAAARRRLDGGQIGHPGGQVQVVEPLVDRAGEHVLLSVAEGARPCR